MVFKELSSAERDGLLCLRELIFDVAESDPLIGTIEETLRWNQPSYLTSETKSGTIIRLGLSKQGSFALFIHCRTTLMAEFRSSFPEGVTFNGNRAIIFKTGNVLPEVPLRLLIKRALTYHL